MTKKLLNLTLLFAMVFTILILPNTVIASENVSTVFYVATDGNDANPGTFDAPFATIIGARNAIRELKKAIGLPEGGITVYIKGGNYQVKENIHFTEEDSGTEDSPIIYKAYNGENVILNGGATISGKVFKAVSGSSMLCRLDESVRRKIVCVNLYDYLDKLPKSKGCIGKGRTSDSSEAGRQAVPEMSVYVGGEQYVTARYPNVDENGYQGMLNIDEIITPKTGTAGPVFTYSDSTPATWQKTNDIWVMGDFPSTWGRFESVVNLDTSKNQVSMIHVPEYTAGAGNRFCFTNVFEELDNPGEYYIDHETGMLYIYPKTNIKQTEVGVTAYSGEGPKGALLTTDNASFITFSGIDITLTRNSAVYIYRGNSVRFMNCEITNIGMEGIAIGEVGGGGAIGQVIRGKGISYEVPAGMKQWPGESDGKPMTKEEYKAVAGYNHEIINCKISNIGRFGVELHGGDRIDLEPANHRLYNCEVSNTGATSVLAQGHGIYVGHNTIKGSPGQAVNICGTDIIVEYNDISDAVKEGSDLGAIYGTSYGCVSYCGTEVRYNYIHDIDNRLTEGDQLGSGYGGDAFRMGIYMDYSSNFLNVHHNIFYNIPFGTYGMGSNYNITDNVFIDVNNPINTRDEAYINNWEKLEDAEACRELYYFKDNEAWLEKYPEFNEYRLWLESVGPDERKQPKNDYSGNLMVYNKNKNKYKEGGFIFQGMASGSEINITADNVQYMISDPGFVDMKNKNFNFNEDSKAVEKNPELGTINFSAIGRNKDQLTTTIANSVILKVGEQDALTFGTSAMVDSSNANVAPVIIDSRTLVPVRFISEAFGCEVGWDGNTQTVSISKDGRIVTMQIGSNILTVDGVNKEIDVPAQIIESRTMVPLRALTEALGKEVFWDDRGLIVISNDADFLNSEEDKEIIDKLVEYVNCY